MGIGMLQVVLLLQSATAFLSASKRGNASRPARGLVVDSHILPQMEVPMDHKGVVTVPRLGNSSNMIDRLPFYLYDYLYKGTWHSLYQDDVLGYSLQHSSGKLLLAMDSLVKGNKQLALTFRVYDDQYIDQELLQTDLFQLRLAPVQPPDQILWMGNTNVTLNRYFRQRKQQSQVISLSYSLLATSQKGGPITTPQDIKFFLKATLTSSDSGFQATLALEEDNTLMQMVLFALLTLFSGTVTYIGVRRANDQFTVMQGIHEKHSILYLATQAGWEGFLFFQLLQTALQTSLVLAPSALVYMMVLIHLFRLLISLWQPRFLDPMANGNTNRNKLLRYIVAIYFTMLLLTLALFYYFDQLWLLMLIHVNLLFQIFHTARSKSRHKSMCLYFLLATMTKPFYVVYCKGFPDNVFNLQPHFTFITCLLLVHYLLLAIVMAQQYFGSQFFIPKCFLPKEFQYEQTVSLESLVDKTCPICLTDFMPQNQEGNAALKDGLLAQKVQVFITPCNHTFHPECLTTWLAHKADCPTCRHKIPVFDA